MSVKTATREETHQNEVRIVQSVQAQLNLPALMLGLAVSSGIVAYLDWSATVSSYAIYPLALSILLLFFPLRSWLRLRGKPRPTSVSVRRIKALERFTYLMGVVWAVIVYLIMADLSPTNNAFVMATIFCLCFAAVGLNPSLPRAAGFYCGVTLFSLLLSSLENEVLRPDILVIAVSMIALILARMILQNWRYVNRNVGLNHETLLAKSALERVSNQLSHYISPQLYEAIFRGDQRVVIESKRKKLTVFFSDIVNFTEITDRLEPEEMTGLLNRYLAAMSVIANEHEANFDKFIGDAMMFYFGDPETRGVTEDASACVQMAISMQKRLSELEIEWLEQGLIDQPFKTRIGINTGYCTVGNFGSEHRMDYTIIGSEVNLAARLQSHAAPGGILMSAETYAQVRSWLQAEECDAISMKGFPKPIRTFEAQIDSDPKATGDRVLQRKIEGMSVTIDLNRIERTESIVALKSILDELEH
ncbi:adenylate/guanylate cyclase domain-containing protein [Ruegeria meonggei]|uniref:adenylate/guanylate cyclase domain-containing protein n=1 Tax=Ruegeria meonggei TaxID=1446476 RepID=UPI0036700A51